MKQILWVLILVVLISTFVGCTNSGLDKKYQPQSIGGITVEDTLKDYSKAFADIDYTSFTGYEILPYVTNEWGKTWLDELVSQYVEAYKKIKLVSTFTSVDISDVVVKDDLASATLVINSIQQKPTENNRKSIPEKVTLIKSNGKWFIDKVEKK